MAKMVANTGRYILSMIDHKSVYKFEDGTELYIAKQWTNNLRERNPQLGTVEAIPDDNWLNLQVGDIIAVNHFTFMGNIDKDRGFILKDHCEIDGVKYFPAIERQMFFKYNNKTPEVLPGYVLFTNVEAEKTLHQDPNTMEFYWTSKFGQKGTITHGHGIFEPGKECLVLQNAFYLITLDGVDYFKVREDEIVAFIENDEAVPIGDNILVEYLPEESQPNYLYYKSKGIDIDWKTYKNCAAKIVKGNINKKRILEWNLSIPNIDGDVLLIYNNQGVKWKDKVILTDNDMIIWRFLDEAEIQCT